MYSLPRVVAALQPRADISERLRRFDQGLKFANAFGGMNRFQPESALFIACGWGAIDPVLYLCNPQVIMLDVGPPSMEKRFLAITFVAIALILGQSANVLVAALCPHLRSSQASCETPSRQTHGDHHNMDHMVTEQETAASRGSTTAEIATLVHSNGPCDHCAVHSRENGSTASIQRSYLANSPHQLVLVVNHSLQRPIFVSEALNLSSRAHGPPGGGRSRHILISIFRI